jgi:hypothetical protein
MDRFFSLPGSLDLLGTKIFYTIAVNKSKEENSFVWLSVVLLFLHPFG